MPTHILEAMLETGATKEVILAVVKAAQPKHFVYIACFRDDGKLEGPVKIGHSGAPQSRLASMQTANPNELVLGQLYEFDEKHGALDLEAAFHEEMTEGGRHIRGEWFDMCPYEARYVLRKIIEREYGAPPQ